ncbi:hypothetical protein J5N97_030304 [Dioscorea zingiberensis]|uniref:Uncharacterized protein n=1 Tax=Dioscorea zingiberensis TaxID=325984 RepID=A0A9D5H448_9LILI|nr:hypothetical protein J5N97_030304 [Dioscorea zingiberensis]
MLESEFPFCDQSNFFASYARLSTRECSAKCVYAIIKRKKRLQGDGRLAGGDPASNHRGGSVEAKHRSLILKACCSMVDVKEDELEKLYEKQNRKAALWKANDEGVGFEVNRVDGLPIKTLDGELRYRTGDQSLEPEP